MNGRQSNGQRDACPLGHVDRLHLCWLSENDRSRSQQHTTDHTYELIEVFHVFPFLEQRPERFLLCSQLAAEPQNSCQRRVKSMSTICKLSTVRAGVPLEEATPPIR
jgi:hypothetical protein